MGSDHAPHPEIDGALAAASDFGVKVILVGQPEKVEPELKRCGWRGDGDRGIELVEAAEVIGMGEPVAELRQTQEEEFFESWYAAGQGREGRRFYFRRQHRRGDGYRENGPGHAARR